MVRLSCIIHKRLAETPIRVKPAQIRPKESEFAIQTSVPWSSHAFKIRDQKHEIKTNRFVCTSFFQESYVFPFVL